MSNVSPDLARHSTGRPRTAIGPHRASRPINERTAGRGLDGSFAGPHSVTSGGPFGQSTRGPRNRSPGRRKISALPRHLLSWVGANTVRTRRDTTDRRAAAAPPPPTLGGYRPSDATVFLSMLFFCSYRNILNKLINNNINSVIYYITFERTDTL